MRELGPYIKAQRQQVSEITIGIHRRAGRRDRGISREDLARLAGMSIHALVRLEQGVATALSTDTALAIARALELDADATAHLLDLAAAEFGRAPITGGGPRTSSAPPAVTVGRSLRQLLHAVKGCPAMVVTSRLDVLAYNDAAREHLLLPLGVGDGLDPEDPINLARLFFASPRSPAVFSGWTDMAHFVVHWLDGSLRRRPSDTDLNALVDELRGLAGFSEVMEELHRAQSGPHREAAHPTSVVLISQAGPGDAVDPGLEARPTSCEFTIETLRDERSRGLWLLALVPS